MPRNPDSLKLTDLFQNRCNAIAAQTEQLVLNGFAKMDPDDAPAFVEAFVPEAARITAMGQARTRDLALGYFQTLTRLELGGTGTVSDPLEGNIGLTADGRAIEEALVATRARFLTGLNESKTVQELLPGTKNGFGRLAFHETMDAGSLELENQMRANDNVRGWRAKSRGTCGGCIAMDSGKLHAVGEGERPPFHGHCKCISEVVFDVKERVKRETGRDRFERLDRAEQVAAIGPDKAKLIALGLVAWDDFVEVDTFAEWTPVVTEATLESLLVKAGITKEELDELEAA